MRTLLAVIAAATLSAFALQGCESDPYAEGSHWDYSIFCEDGFLWKSMGNRGTIPLLHSDGKQMRCGEKRH